MFSLVSASCAHLLRNASQTFPHVAEALGASDRTDGRLINPAEASSKCPEDHAAYLGGRPRGGRMGAIAGVRRRRGPDQSAGTASTAAATA
jgi:hypothetical protein